MIAQTTSTPAVPAVAEQDSLKQNPTATSSKSADWVQLTDPQNGKPFYANTVTGEYSWDKPIGFSEGGEGVADGINHSATIAEWWELFDEGHQLPYFYNTSTKQTEWIRPEGVRIVNLSMVQKMAGSDGFPLNLSGSSSTATKGNVQAETAATPTTPVAPANSTYPKARAASLATVPVAESSMSGNSGNVGTSTAAAAGGLSPVVERKLTTSQPLHGQQVNSPPLQHQRSLPLGLKNEINQFKLEGFAQKYFSTHKKGIFRKKVPVEKMLAFSKDAIPLPLMKLNPDLHKDALKSFKCVQRAMGDRQTKKTISEEIQELCASGINHGELRDEIYCQIVKQLTKNPKQESVYRGWEIMATMVVTFPPSKNFEQYLVGFIADNCHSSDEKISTFAKHCAVKLERISKKGPRGKVLTIPEIDRAREAAFQPSVFGESLGDVMDAQREKYPDRKLPFILTYLANEILRLNGSKTEGIFRVPGDADHVTDLRLRLEKGKYDMTGITDASVPGSLLKFWLRDLTDPIIPHELYQYCITNAENTEKTIEVLERLPEHNKNVLMYLINFLQIVGAPENQAATRMSVNNIAMVFAPNVLRCPSENLQVILENTKYEQAFVRTLINGLKTDAFYTMQ